MALVFRSNHKWYITEDFGIIPPRDKTDTPIHTHDFVEFVYIFHGSCTHIVNGLEYVAQKGDLIFINYNSTHSIHSEYGVNYADILLKPAFIDESLRGTDNAFSLLRLPDFNAFESIVRTHNCIIHFDGEERRRVENLIHWALEEQEQETIGSSLVLKSFVNIFLTIVFRKMSLPMYSVRNLDEELLVYIREHCGEKLTLSEFATQCGYCSVHFSRLFKRYTGVTFSAYLTRCRLEKAEKMMQESSKPVEQIINECGFTDRTRFFTLFTQHTGSTPLQYRKKLK